MPELPEVETVVRCLRPRVAGHEVRRVRVFFPPIVRRPGPRGLRTLEGRRVLDVERRGKVIIIRLSGGISLLFHLKMTGQLFLSPAGAGRDKHTHLSIAFRDTESELRFRDIRKFGFALAVPTAEAAGAPELSRLGPEPLAVGFADFRSAFAGRKGKIKARLLDQSIVAGIGNIYADEILYAARIHPETDVARLGPAAWRRLWTAVRAVLRRAIRHRGTTISDYRDGDGEPGGFQSRLRVYGREGLACPRCGAKIHLLRIAGRSSHFCPRCQRRSIILGASVRGSVTNRVVSKEREKAGAVGRSDLEGSARPKGFSREPRVAGGEYVLSPKAENGHATDVRETKSIKANAIGSGTRVTQPPRRALRTRR